MGYYNVTVCDQVIFLPLTIQEVDTEASLECHTRSASSKLLGCQIISNHVCLPTFLHAAIY